MVPISIKILGLLGQARKAESSFKFFNEQWDHNSIEGADIYVKLLDQWDKAVNEFAPYANQWYIAQYGLSLN